MDLNFDKIGSSPFPRKLAALSAFASVRTLKLWLCTFPSFAALRYTLSSLPSLTHLTVADTTWPTASTLEPFLPFLRSSRKSPFLKRVRYLYFRDGDTTSTCEDQMLQWLSATSLAASLSDLSVSSGALMKTRKLWDYVGSSTTRLSIGSIKIEELLNDSKSRLECNLRLTGLPRSLMNHI